MKSKLWAISSQVMLWSSSGNKHLKMLIQIHHLSLLELDVIQYDVFFDTYVCVKLIELMFVLPPVENILSKCGELWHRKGSDPCFIQRGSCLLLSICVANRSGLLKALFHPAWPFFFFFFLFLSLSSRIFF